MGVLNTLGRQNENQLAFKSTERGSENIGIQVIVSGELKIHEYPQGNIQWYQQTLSRYVTCSVIKL